MLFRSGEKAKATVDSYQLNEDGSKVQDTYGTDYPNEVTFELIPEALEDGFVPLQVFVPIMDAISAGSGKQDVYLKLNWNTIEKDTDLVKAFVARLYTEVLGREADEKGLNEWTEVLKAQKETGAKVAMGFVDSDEIGRAHV